MNGGGNELLSSPDPELRFCLQNLVWIVLATGGPGKGQSEMTHEPGNEEEKLYFFTGSGTGSADHQQVQEVGTCEILEIRQKEPSRESSEPCSGTSPGSVWANENGVSGKGCLPLKGGITIPPPTTPIWGLKVLAK